MAIETHIESLRNKHQALEEQLADLAKSPSSSDTDIADVKRQKLHLKDEINRLSPSAA